jgi:hypothetical protein
MEADLFVLYKYTNTDVDPSVCVLRGHTHTHSRARAHTHRDSNSYLQLGGAAAAQAVAHFCFHFFPPQLGGAGAVRVTAQRQRDALQSRLAEADFLALQWHSQNALSSM